jgi:hypothetical protein
MWRPVRNSFIDKFIKYGCVLPILAIVQKINPGTIYQGLRVSIVPGENRGRGVAECGRPAIRCVRGRIRCQCSGSGTIPGCAALAGRR